MRITGGRYRGRPLEAPDSSKPGKDGGKGQAPLRPTADRAREALFNQLSHPGKLSRSLRTDDSPLLFPGCRFADLFAGTGAVGLEALSREAGQVIFVEKNRSHLELIRRNADRLDASARARFLQADATALPPCPDGPVDILFMDAPYRLGLSLPALASARDQGWITPDSLVLIELAAKGESLLPDDDSPAGELSLPEGWSLLDDRSHGAARILFLAWREDPDQEA